MRTKADTVIQLSCHFFDNNIQFIDAEDGINGRVYDCNMMRSRKVFAQKVARGATKIHVNHAQQTYTNR